jgi:hypothetical protein
LSLFDSPEKSHWSKDCRDSLCELLALCGKKALFSVDSYLTLPKKPQVSPILQVFTLETLRLCVFARPFFGGVTDLKQKNLCQSVKSVDQ